MATKKQAATTRIHRTKAAITSTPLSLPEELQPVEGVDIRSTTELRIAEQAKLAGQPVTIVPASLARADADEKQAKAAAKPKAPKTCHAEGCTNPRHVQSGGAVMSLCLPCFQTYHANYAAPRKAKKETPA